MGGVRFPLILPVHLVGWCQWLTWRSPFQRGLYRDMFMSNVHVLWWFVLHNWCLEHFYSWTHFMTVFFSVDFSPTSKVRDTTRICWKCQNLPSDLSPLQFLVLNKTKTKRVLTREFFLISFCSELVLGTLHGMGQFSLSRIATVFLSTWLPFWHWQSIFYSNASSECVFATWYYSLL